MDIKLRDKYISKINSKKGTRVLFILLAYMMSILLISFNDILKYRSYLTTLSYFESSEFVNEIVGYHQSVMDFYTNFRDYSKKSNDEKVTQDEIKELQKQYADELSSSVQAIKNSYDFDISNAEQEKNEAKLKRLIEERDNEIKEVTKEQTKTAEDIKLELVNSKDIGYAEFKNKIDTHSGIKYYLKDLNTDEVFTNIRNLKDINTYIRDKSIYSTKFPGNLNSHDMINNLDKQYRLDGELASATFEGYYIVLNESEAYSDIQIKYREFNNNRWKFVKEIILFLVCIGAVIFILLHLRKQNKLRLILTSNLYFYYKSIPLDIRFGVFLLCSFLISHIVTGISLFNNLGILSYIMNFTFIALYIVYLALIIANVVNFKSDKKELRIQWEKSCIYKIRNKLKNSSRNSTLTKSTAVRVWIFVILTMAVPGAALLGIIGLNAGSGTAIIIAILYIISYFFIIVIKVFEEIKIFTNIVKATDEIAAGNLNYAIEPTGNGDLWKFANNINNMKEGFKRSVEAQVKSERLKTELITNVSHDLKTPLTSIINYIDLLKNDGLSVDEVKDYVGVLDRKAQRLKTLIEDLFDASKMASGSVELDLEKVDIGALIHQTLGEFDEKIKASTLNFKVNVPREKFFSILDGKKTWRVFENIIGNIFKYSQVNTRVYIDLVEIGDKYILTMKNISAYEMEFSADEIFERFKRGDKSRNTEGSGLGLAIAKSIMELQGGRLLIDIDGDLFKAIVEFNK